jgi:hypothetical protein
LISRAAHGTIAGMRVGVVIVVIVVAPLAACGDFPRLGDTAGDGGAIDGVGPDAPRPDASCLSTTTTTQQLLVNGYFDDAPIGTGWTQLPAQPMFPPIVDNLPPGEHTLPYGVWIGGWEFAADEALYQELAIPGNTLSLLLTGYKYISGQDLSGTPHDFARFQIRDTAGVLLETFETYSNLPENDTAWTPFAVGPADSYAGRTIRLHVEGQSDASIPTNFFFDSFALTATLLVCE